MSEPSKTRPKMPIPVVRPSGTHQKPLPYIDPKQVTRMSQTSVYHPKNAGQAEQGAADQSQETGVLVQVPSGPVMQGLPETLIDPAKAAAVQVPEFFSFDAGTLLPQLTTGRIVVPLESIISQIQGEITRAGANAKELVKLPLAVVVPNIPPELLQIEGQQTQEIDPNFVESPFAEGGKAAKAAQLDAPLPPSTASPAPAQQQAPIPPPAAPPAPTPTIVMLPGTHPPAPAPLPSSATGMPQVPPPPATLMVPAPPSSVPPPPATPSAPKPSVRVESPAPAQPGGPAPTSVRLYLATFLKRLPEEVLTSARDQLLESAGERIVELPMELLVPQLATGRITLEYSVLYPYLPPEMLVPVNSANKAHAVPLPLERIVPQIPADMLGLVAGQALQLPEDSDIPKELFTDKRAGDAHAPTAKAAPAAAAVPAPVPVDAPPDVPADKLRPVETRDLEIGLTPDSLDEGKILERVNRYQLYELIEINGLSLAQARKLTEQREKSQKLTMAELKELGIRRKSLLRLLGMPDPSGAVNVSVLNRLLTLTDQRTLKVQEIIDTAVSKFGIDAGMMVAEDGLVLAGKPPEGVDKQMISAFLPQIYRHLARGLSPAGTGSISRITIILEKHLVTLFRASGIFLLFWHSREKMNKEFFKRVERLTEELSRQNLSAA